MYIIRILLFLTQLLHDSSHLVRCKCLELIGALGSPYHSMASDVDQSQSSTSTLSVLGNFSRDPDGRVRTQSFQSMVCLFCVSLCDLFVGILTLVFGPDG